MLATLNGWPEAFAIVGVAWAVVAVLYILFTKVEYDVGDVKEEK